MATSPIPTSIRTLPGRICVAVQGETPEQLFALSARCLAGYAFQELRLDYLPDPAAALDALRAHLLRHPAATFLITCRPQASGGRWQATPVQELELLTRAAHAGARWVDLSLQSAEALGPEALQELRANGVHLVLSWHDFDRTGDLQRVADRMQAFHPDLQKIVPTAQQLEDNLAVFDLLGGQERGPLVAMAMGEAGMPSRILGPRQGSAFTFAASEVSAGTAPGQLDAGTLRNLYRADRLTSTTRIFGVAGDPIHSSLSPLMLNTAFQEAGLDAVDLPLRTGSAEELLRFAQSVALAGCSVTMPLKQAILPLLQRVDTLANCIGAVNTLRREPDGSYTGFNTDAAGITVPLGRRLRLQGARILVLGAGGAARAAAFGCLAEGAEVSVLNRTFAGASALASESGAKALRPEDLPGEAPFDALLQATPAGMAGTPTDLPVPLNRIHVGLVFDLVYNPLETPLLLAARQQGLAVIPGVEMFLHQGVRQFELWTGQPAPVQAMRRVVLEALASR